MYQLSAVHVNHSMKINLPKMDTTTSFEQLVEDALDMFKSWVIPEHLNQSSFQHVRVDNEHIGLTPQLDLSDGTTINVEYMDTTKYTLYKVSTDQDGGDFDIQPDPDPDQVHYPLMEYPRGLRNTTFAKALNFVTDKYGIVFQRCMATKPPKDPFREGRRPLEVMWLFFTTTDWPPDQVWVVTTSLTAWGVFTIQDFDLRAWPYDPPNGAIHNIHTSISGYQGASLV